MEHHTREWHTITDVRAANRECEVRFEAIEGIEPYPTIPVLAAVVKLPRDHDAWDVAISVLDLEAMAQELRNRFGDGSRCVLPQGHHGHHTLSVEPGGVYFVDGLPTQRCGHVFDQRTSSSAA